jgi:hypothetical protein
MLGIYALMYGRHHHQIQPGHAPIRKGRAGRPSTQLIPSSRGDRSIKRVPAMAGVAVGRALSLGNACSGLEGSILCNRQLEGRTECCIELMVAPSRTMADNCVSGTRKHEVSLVGVLQNPQPRKILAEMVALR